MHFAIEKHLPFTTYEVDVILSPFLYRAKRAL
jgi:hypothetical protein